MGTVIIIGGGASGMIAACFAARRGQKVKLFEKNSKLGKKLLITGKGRCNLTNSSSVETLIENVPGNPYFLYSSFYGFDSNSTIEFFNSIGLDTKIERGNRVFPKSDKASDVVKTLEKQLYDQGVEVYLNAEIHEIKHENGRVKGVLTNKGNLHTGRSVLIATGGLSYPATGSTGDGYKFARAVGHTVSKLYPSLSPLKTYEPWVSQLQGLSLKNVGINVNIENKSVYKDFGEMMFTHYGVSGPIILSCSRYLLGKYEKMPVISIDLKPAMDEKELDTRILRDFSKYGNKDYKNCLDDLLPKKLIPVFIELSGISPNKKAHDITKEERKSIIKLLKTLKVTVQDSTGFNEAVITCGGVITDEIDPSTMQSKIVEGLYFCGEVLDVDAYTGGFNLQIAFSTGRLAGINI